MTEPGERAVYAQGFRRNRKYDTAEKRLDKELNQPVPTDKNLPTVQTQKYLRIFAISVSNKLPDLLIEAVTSISSQIGHDTVRDFCARHFRISTFQKVLNQDIHSIAENPSDRTRSMRESVKELEKLGHGHSSKMPNMFKESVRQRLK